MEQFESIVWISCAIYMGEFIYISGTTRGNPGLPYKSYAVILLLSELLNQWLRMRYDNDSKNQWEKIEREHIFVCNSIIYR